MRRRKKMVNEEEEAYTTPVKMPAWSGIHEYPINHLFSTCDEHVGDFSVDDLKIDGLKFPGGISSNESFPADFYGGEEFPVDFYSSDEFRMYEFKVRRCPRGRSHDWTECPFAHPGEKARRRDPRKYRYSGVPCPDFRKGSCKRGDACEFSHGVFEYWLHPTRYRTELCKDGTACRRRVCFFAHTPEQLRVFPSPSTSKMITSQNLETYDGSPLRLAMDANLFYPKPVVLSSPTSTLLPTPLSPPSDSSPPLSPLQRSLHSNSVNQVLVSLRQLQLSKARSGPSWGTSMGGSFASPKPPCNSLPSTPTTESGWLDLWERGYDEEPVERVESGRDLRNKIFEKLSKENSVEIFNDTAPDVGWVSGEMTDNQRGF